MPVWLKGPRWHLGPTCIMQCWNVPSQPARVVGSPDRVLGKNINYLKNRCCQSKCCFVERALCFFEAQ